MVVTTVPTDKLYAGAGRREDLQDFVVERGVVRLVKSRRYGNRVGVYEFEDGYVLNGDGHKRAVLAYMIAQETITVDLLGQIPLGFIVGKKMNELEIFTLEGRFMNLNQYNRKHQGSSGRIPLSLD